MPQQRRGNGTPRSCCPVWLSESVCGIIVITMPAHRSLADRFHEKYERIPFSGCWIWKAAISKKGYGQICVYHDRARSAHRVSWELHKGKILNGLWVLHQCDVPACVNPDHLFLGTLADNWADCVQKARSGRPTIRGEKNKSAKLTAENVADIKTKRISQRAFGKLYGVSHTTVGYIQLGKKWKE